jgi:hypothetical protein
MKTQWYHNSIDQMAVMKFDQKQIIIIKQVKKSLVLVYEEKV